MSEFNVHCLATAIQQQVNIHNAHLGNVLLRVPEGGSSDYLRPERQFLWRVGGNGRGHLGIYLEPSSSMEDNREFSNRLNFCTYRSDKPQLCRPSYSYTWLYVSWETLMQAKISRTLLIGRMWQLAILLHLRLAMHPKFCSFEAFLGIPHNSIKF